MAERTEIERRGGEVIGGASYAELLDEVRRQVRAARVRAARAVNAELIDDPRKDAAADVVVVEGVAVATREDRARGRQLALRAEPTA